MRDRLGLGVPTEAPFFADVYVPSTVDLAVQHPSPRPVKVFVHGGFLQFGSTSGQYYNQQFFAAEHFHEVRVLLGHRLSVLGFLASAAPPVAGNFGFKDVWVGLQWVKDNIASFGGDPDDIHVSGLSGGAHVVHQLLHVAARRGQAPFVSATLLSNAILTNALTPASRADQFAAFCSALGAEHDIAALRDEEKYPTDALIQAVHKMGEHGTFRGVVEEGWVHPNQMEYQRSGALGRDLVAAGVKVVVTGDVRDEDAFYSIVHDCTPDTLLANVARYYPLPLARALLDAYDAEADHDPQSRLGRLLADGQVHIPVRMLARDLAKGGLPTVRYSIEYVAEAMGHGVVSHGSDLALQHLRLSVLSRDEVVVALGWHLAIEQAIRPALDGGEFIQRDEEEVLLLNKLGETAWARDWRWPLLRRAEAALISS